ncbi:MAG: dihydroneopterin aldolase [Candidatus Neomarinimicrobiota bacterium]
MKNMVFYGYHGVSDSEKNLGGKFEIDLDLDLDLKKACLTDNLEDTVNYESIYKTVDSCINQKKFYLIEALASSIAERIFNKYAVEKLTIRVRKPHAPVKGVLDTVEVEIQRDKTDYV